MLRETALYKTAYLIIWRFIVCLTCHVRVSQVVLENPGAWPVLVLNTVKYLGSSADRFYLPELGSERFHMCSMGRIRQQEHHTDGK